MEIPSYYGREIKSNIKGKELHYMAIDETIKKIINKNIEFIKKDFIEKETFNERTNKLKHEIAALKKDIQKLKEGKKYTAQQ